MRTQSKTTTITYAGRVILAPGDMLSGETFSGERNYTTSATPLVMSERPAIDNYGNATGSQSFTICRDFDSFELLLEHLLELQNFADANQTGDLIITSGAVSKTVEAGLTNFRYEVSLAASYRLSVGYDFLLI